MKTASQHNSLAVGHAEFHAAMPVSRPTDGDKKLIKDMTSIELRAERDRLEGLVREINRRLSEMQNS